MSEIGFEPNSVMNLYYDNKAAIEISHNQSNMTAPVRPKKIPIF